MRMSKNKARGEEQIFDVMSLACEADLMTRVSHPEFEKISKGSIDVIIVPTRKNSIVIDRRSCSNNPAVYSNIKLACANMR